MLEGALTLLSGIVVGRVLPARRRVPKRPSPTEPICGCGHGLHDHDPESKQCWGPVEKYRYNLVAELDVMEDVPCTCRHYVGPEPLPSYTADIAT